MAIALLGINHTSAPVQLRERVAFNPADIAQSLNALCNLESVEEGVILSTCNRTEIYIAHNNSDSDDIKSKLLSWIQNSHALDDTTNAEISNSVYFKTEQESLRHLLAVSCGLDSMVLGEPQIFGQVKNAYQNANVHGTVKQELDNVFQFVFHTAKKIRTETEIGNHAVSLASAAVNLGRKIFSGFEKHTAILIGAGETIELVAQHLHQQGCKRMVFANRSIENAHRLAHEFQAYSIGLDDLNSHLSEADIIFSSTASPDPILYYEDFKSSMKTRKHKPIFIVDLAVPRDIDPAVKELDDIYLYSIDDLQEIISGNQSARRHEAEKANLIVNESLEQFTQNKNLREASPAIRELREHFIEQRDELLSTALEKLTSDNAEKILTQLAHQLTNRFLHQPTKELRTSISDENAKRVEEILKILVNQGKEE